ncbi:MAG: MucR family transcriptional regulator [Deltaproteobacteria bacterium]|nr:MAG: MucR family transcriptional regulator [Deltaproteobacteria bacterium]
MDKRTLLQMTADIVASHASMNELAKDDLLKEIDQVFAKLASLSDNVEINIELPDASEVEEGAEGKPAVPLEAAFGADKVFCMVCGKGMKTLKRHLSTAHDLKPGQYRKQYNIPAGTPLVAKNYSEKRKEMAQSLNLAERLVKARAARGKKKKK